MKGPYNETVMEHFMNPRNMGEIEDANAKGEVGNPSCGDMMYMFMKIENNVIQDVKFKTFGCGAAIASSSITTEMLKGKTIEEALAVRNEDIVNQLGGLPEVKIHCSIMAEEAIESAIKDYFKRIGEDPEKVEQIKMAVR